MRSLIFCVALAGCTNDNAAATTLDMSCVEGATQCINDSLAQVCSGGVWLAKPCFASACMNGDCLPPTSAGTPCVPNSSVCGGPTTALTCNPSGVGYVAKDCPPNTLCVGAGACVGSCTVGFTKCVGNNQLLTCSDGFTFTASDCPMGTLCVIDTTRPNNPGVCAMGDCMPDAFNGCNTVCGIMGPSPSPAATNYVSTCVNTNSPLGWRWQATQCLGPKSCDPAGADCGLNPRKQQAACVSQCTPTAVRCAGIFSIQTCDANGNWGAATACAGGLTCTNLISGMGPVCADPACATGAQGICVDVNGVSELRACSAGKLAAAPAPCTVGVCVHDSSVPNVASGIVGLCAPECQMGDQACKGNGLQGCTAGGTWSSTITDCPAATTCHTYNDPASGRPNAVCGVCNPLIEKRCVDGGGAPGLGPLPNYEICGLDGQWGPSTTCTLGQCSGVTAPPCAVQCLPGAQLCVGALPPSPLPGIPYAGTSAVATCTAQGLNPGQSYPNTPGTDPCWIGGAPPAGVTCCSTVGGGTIASCRSDVAGGGIGCVACVGSGTDEAGLLDTRCSNLTGTDFGNAAVQTCLANDSGWGPAVACTIGTCHPPTPTPAPLPLQSIVPTCNPCPINGVNRMCSDANWSTIGSSCLNAGLGGPVSCPGPFNTGAVDCCAAACYVTNPPTPAVCGG